MSGAKGLVVLHPDSLGAQARGSDRLIGWMLLLAGLLLLAGWLLPIMTVSKLWFLSERVSVLQGVADLWRHGDLFLALVIVIFSMLFPVAKLALAGFIWLRLDCRGPALVPWLRRVERLGPWSMLDVFVVALLVVAIQGSLISEVELHAGTYVFAAAVLLSIFAVQRMTGLAQRAASSFQDEG